MLFRIKSSLLSLNKIYIYIYIYDYSISSQDSIRRNKLSFISKIGVKENKKKEEEKERGKEKSMYKIKRFLFVHISMAIYNFCQYI